MPKILFLFAVCSFVLQLGCKESTIGPEIDPLLLKVSGNYKATTFILPGSNDASINILAHGGSISIALNNNFVVEGRYTIPKINGINSDGIDQVFGGKFVFINNKLQFLEFNNILSHPQLFFEIKENKLEGSLMGISPIIIVLEKNN